MKNEGKLSDGQYEKNRLLNRNFYFLWQNQRASISKEAKSRMESRIKARLSVSTLKSGTIVFRGQHVVAKTEIGLSWPLPGINKIMGTSPYCTCTAVAPGITGRRRSEERRRKVGNRTGWLMDL